MENITEEFENKNVQTIFEDFVFLTLEELEDLNGKYLMSQGKISSYMNGYLISKKDYQDLNTKINYDKYLEVKIDQEI